MTARGSVRRKLERDRKRPLYSQNNFEILEIKPPNASRQMLMNEISYSGVSIFAEQELCVVTCVSICGNYTILSNSMFFIVQRYLSVREEPQWKGKCISINSVYVMAGL